MTAKNSDPKFADVKIKTPPLPQGPFSVILADPPWDFRTWSKKNQNRSAENHYPVMKLKDIKALPVQQIANPESCILFLWVIDPMLKHGIQVMEDWGFEYKTVGFTWIKPNQGQEGKLYEGPICDEDFFMGTGYYTRADPEMCLIGVMGKPPKRKSRSVRQLTVAPRREHSRKPDVIYSKIEALVDGPYLEMFARQQWSPEWKTWGVEKLKFGKVKK